MNIESASRTGRAPYIADIVPCPPKHCGAFLSVEKARNAWEL